jgi:hypothetical protein
VEECAAEWGLELEEPFVGGFVSHVVPVGDAVLKIQWPHRESEHEADALEQWRRDGALRLLARATSGMLFYSSAAVPELRSERRRSTCSWTFSRGSGSLLGRRSCRWRTRLPGG